MADANTTPSNTGSYEKFIKDIRQLGGEAALGKDALPKLALRVIDAVTQGVIGYDRNQDGTDTADEIYGEYAKYESKKAIHTRNAASLKAQVSKLRQVIKAAVMPSCDFKGTAVRVTEISKEMTDQGAKVKSLFPALVDVAREQQKHDRDLSEEQIKETITKTASEDPTVSDILNKALKALDGLITGEGRHGLKDQHELTIAAHDALKQRLAALELSTRRDRFEAMAAELGYAVMPQAA